MSCESCIKLIEINKKLQDELDNLKNKLYENDDTDNEIKKEKRETSFVKKIKKLSKSQDFDKIINSEIIFLGMDENIKCVCGKLTDIAYVYFNYVTHNIIFIGEKCAKKYETININYNIEKLVMYLPIKKETINNLLKYKQTIVDDIVIYIINNKFQNEQLSQIIKIISFIINNFPQHKNELTSLLDYYSIREQQARLDLKRTCKCNIQKVCCCEDRIIEMVLSENIQYPYCIKCNRFICRGCDDDYTFII